MIRVGRSPIHGRGVFATEDVAPRRTLVRCPTLPVNGELDGYVFEPGLLALGPISLLNHGEDPNCRVVLGAGDPPSISLVTRRAVRRGEELTITYGEEYWS